MNYIYICVYLKKKKKVFKIFIMSCSSPIFAIDFGLDPISGKRHIKFANMDKYYNLQKLESLFGLNSIFALPCGKCDGCKLDYRKEWSVRCLLESTCHDHNCFITLTYDEINYPGKLVKKDLQSFFIRLQKKHPGVRYFACGEYGSRTSRAHYHAIIFGYDFSDDKRFFSKTKQGDYVYTSKELSFLWPYGQSLIGDVTESSCSYVAGYVGKKVDNSGFLLMSNRPGIGAQYFIEHLSEIYVNDNIVLKNGSVVSPPRYCDILAQRYGYDLAPIIQKRLELQRLSSNHEMINHSYLHREMTYKDKLVKNTEKKARLKRNDF